VRDELERYRVEKGLIGDALLFTRPNNPAEALDVRLATRWLRRAERLAKLDPLPGGAFHPMRRSWATARKHMPLKDVAATGGWADTQTLLRCYTMPDEEMQEQVVMQPRRFVRLG
jgi:integrase